MKTLIIQGSPRTESTGKAAAEILLNEFLSKKYDITETTRVELYKQGLQDYSQEYMNDFYNPNKDLSESDRSQEAIRSRLLDQFIENDIVIITMPKYNFSYPSTVKNYIDALFKIGKSYDTKRPLGDNGLLEAKTELIVIVTTGDPTAGLDKGLETSIREVFTYLNLDSTLKIIPIELVHGLSPEQVKEVIAEYYNK